MDEYIWILEAMKEYASQFPQIDRREEIIRDCFQWLWKKEYLMITSKERSELTDEYLQSLDKK